MFCFDLKYALCPSLFSCQVLIGHSSCRVCGPLPLLVPTHAQQPMQLPFRWEAAAQLEILLEFMRISKSCASSWALGKCNFFFYDFLAFIAFFSVRFAFTAFRLALRPFSGFRPTLRPRAAASRSLWGSFVALQKYLYNALSSTWQQSWMPMQFSQLAAAAAVAPAATAAVVHPDNNNVAAGCADKNDWGNCKRQQEQKMHQ